MLQWVLDDVIWSPVAAAGNRECHVALWPVEVPVNIATWPVTNAASQRRIGTTRSSFVRISPCKLDIGACSELSASQRFGGSPCASDKVERVGLPGRLVARLLSDLCLPTELAGRLSTHSDDEEEWVYSRCLAVDFSNFSEAEAAWLSSQGRLSCWASMVVMPVRREGPEGEVVKSDLVFVVHKVVSC